MAEPEPMRHVTRLADIKIAPGIKGVRPGTFVLVRGESPDPATPYRSSYAILAEGEPNMIFLDSFEADSDQEAIKLGLQKIPGLIKVKE